MLVLTRKLNEQILIGDDIKVTLTRVTGNTVRLGIEAPKDVRIVRGELGPKESEATELGGGPQISEREQAFAHPEKPTATNRLDTSSEPKVFVGTVKRNGDDAKLMRAPLADFISTSGFVSAS